MDDVTAAQKKAGLDADLACVDSNMGIAFGTALFFWRSGNTVG